MNLYEKNNNKVDVYTLIPIEDRIKEYKRAQLEKEDINSLFYYMETDNEIIMDRFYNGEILNIIFLNSNNNDLYSKIENRQTKAYQKQLLEKYFNGDYSNVLPTQTFIPDGGVDCRLKSYLKTNFYNTIHTDQKIIYTLDNIIRLSDDLCDLQLLLNGNISQFNYFNMWKSESENDELLRLFKVSKNYSIDLEELLKIAKSDLVSEIPDRIELEINTKSKLLRRIKELS